MSRHKRGRREEGAYGKGGETFGHPKRFLLEDTGRRGGGGESHSPFLRKKNERGGRK